MIPKRLDDITEPDLQQLIDNKVGERKTLDYKLEPPTDDTDAKQKFLANVSSFANTAGGDFQLDRKSVV